LRDAVAFERHPVETLDRRHQTGGEVFRLTSFVAGEMVVVATPDLAHEVLHAPTGTYLAGAANGRILPVLPENTVLTLDGERHRERRRLLAPMFHGEALEAIAPVIRESAAREIERWPRGRPFAVLPRTRFLALSIAARLILGVEDQSFVKQLDRDLRTALPPYSMLSGIESLARLGPISPQATAERRRQGFARGLAEVLRGRPDQRAGQVAAAPANLSSDEVLALLLAGHETTATALAWAIDLLAHAPHAADTLAGEDSASEQPWLDAVIWEALRLRPPLVDIVRQPVEPVRLAGRTVPPGTLVLISPALIHRHGGVVDSEGFQPERFVGRRPDPHEWVPFGGGDRRCLGAALAMLELREILPLIVERFAVAPVLPAPERPRLYGTALVPARGARIVLHERQGAESRGPRPGFGRPGRWIRQPSASARVRWWPSCDWIAATVGRSSGPRLR
jgi:cytochrome P450